MKRLCKDCSHYEVCSNPVTEHTLACDLYFERRHGWISVKDKLPERDEKVLCYYGFEKDGKIHDMRFIGCLDYYAYDKEPHFQHASTGLYVTHWMPLPEPPEEDGEQ